MHLFRLSILPAAFSLSLTSFGLAQDDLLEKFLHEEHESNPAAESWLQELLETPLDLNRVNAAELQRLPFLSLEQVAAFLAERQREVYFTSATEALRALRVHGDTLTICREIFVARPPSATRTSINKNAALRSRVGAPAQVESNWLGAKYRMYHRARVEYGAFRAGALTERDPGELHWDDHRVGFVEWQAPQSRLVFGNFQTEWGLGLALWGPYAATITSEVFALSRRWGRTVMPYLSANENAMYRGAAFAHARAHWSTMLFVHSNTRDATLRENEFVVAYRTSGYHRTASENAQRDNLREQTLGAALSYRWGPGRELGVLYYAEKFDRVWQVANPRTGYFDFTGAHNAVASVMGTWQGQQQKLSFEIAQSRSRGRAAALTFAAQEKRMSWNLAAFHADRNFHSSHSRSLTDSEAPLQAAAGYAFGAALRLPARMRGEAFYQHESNLWRTVAAPLPPHARHAGAEIAWQVRADLLTRLRYTFTEHEEAQSRSGVARWRFQLEQRLTKRLRLQPRLDWVRAPRMALGTALALDVLYRVSSHVMLNLRQTNFDTMLPLYQYERDLPGVFSVVALRERGYRRYIYGQLKLLNQLSVAAKISFQAFERGKLGVGEQRAWGVQCDWNFE